MSSKRSSAFIPAPLPTARTLTPRPSAASSASSARRSASTTSASGTARSFGRAEPPSFARFSVSRTDQPELAASRASCLRSSAVFAIRIARPWPSLRAPASRSSSASSGRSRIRIRFESAARLRPEAPAELLLGQPEVLDQRGAGACLVHGVELLAGDVLDQRHLHALGLGLVAKERPGRFRAPLPAPRASGARRR